MIEHSERLDELFAAMAKAQAAVQAASKDKTNPHFRAKYADLASVWDACREPLTANGLDVTQWPMTVEGGVAVTSVLGHTSGQWMASTLTIPLAGNATAQQIGSALTYARRYMLAAVAGVAPEDDDGNEASKGAPKETQRRTTTTRKSSGGKDKAEASGSTTTDHEAEEAMATQSAVKRTWREYEKLCKVRELGANPLGAWLERAQGKPLDVAAQKSAGGSLPLRIWERCQDLLIREIHTLSKEREPGEDPEESAA